MIGKADQQLVIKLDNMEVLSQLVTEHVCPHKKFATRLQELKIPADASWSTDDSLAIKLLEILNEKTILTRNKDESWDLTLGSAKKVIKISHANLSVALCKAIIIYVRKFL